MKTGIKFELVQEKQKIEGHFYLHGELAVRMQVLSVEEGAILHDGALPPKIHRSRVSLRILFNRLEYTGRIGDNPIELLCNTSTLHKYHAVLLVRNAKFLSEDGCKEMVDFSFVSGPDQIGCSSFLQRNFILWLKELKEHLLPEPVLVGQEIWVKPTHRRKGEVVSQFCDGKDLMEARTDGEGGYATFRTAADSPLCQGHT